MSNNRIPLFNRKNTTYHKEFEGENEMNNEEKTSESTP